MTKPRTAAGYDSSYVRHVRDTSLYVATKLGDLIDELVIVGGLAPSLLIDQAQVCSRKLRRVKRFASLPKTSKLPTA